MSARIRTGLAVVVSVLFLAACARGTSDLEQWVADVRQEPPEPIEPIEPIRPAEVVAYDAEGLRDPFRARSPRQEVDDLAVDDSLRPDPDRRREYLEGFPLDTLAMVGTLEIGGELYALIRDNENVVHRVTQGNHMGQNYGEILEVQPDRVELRELVQDGRGGWTERRARVALAEQ
jgi:type IV pilus assembly protein PilP